MAIEFYEIDEGCLSLCNQTYDFIEDVWLDSTYVHFFWIVPWPYPDGKDFETTLKEMMIRDYSHLGDIKVSFYKGNETFGVSR